MDIEEWKPIEGYEDRYEISNFGRVKSLERKDLNNHLLKERILKPKINRDGYSYLQLCYDGNKKGFFVHRLVAAAFIDNPNGYPVVNHKDENKQNNYVSNLEWCTVLYNNRYGTKAIRTGEHYAKAVVQLTMEGDYIRTFKSLHDVYRKFGYAPINISRCCNHVPKKLSAYGYKWLFESEYKELNKNG